jgi:hypothetical protein
MAEEHTYPLTVKVATQDEFDRIHQLNHETFAEEIPQHEKRLMEN